MNSKYILLFGSIVTIGLTILWAFDIVKEPMVGLATGILTLLGFLFQKKRENDNGKSVKQKNTGTGDNVGGDNTVKYGKIKANKAKIITQGQSGGENTVNDSKK